MRKNYEMETIEDFTELSDRFSIEEIDDWKTSAGLAETAIQKLEERFPKYSANLFAFNSETREYREMDREGLASIPEESIFIACLAMREEGVALDDFFEEYSLDDPLLRELFYSAYGARWIQPIVHRFRLLGFLLLCVQTPTEEFQLDKEELLFLHDVSSRLKTNLYAASIADERQRGLLALAEFPSRLRAKESAAVLVDSVLEELRSEIQFDAGVYYEYDDFEKILRPRVWTGLEVEPSILSKGEGISGTTVERMRAVAVASREKHPSFAVTEKEEFIRGSFLTAPLATDKHVFGVITLIRFPENKEEFGVEQRYTIEIASAFIASELDSRSTYDELERSYFTTISSLTKALDAKDPYTRGHSERVMEYATATAKILGLSENSQREIRYAAILHDIGKIGISDMIITKPSRLTDQEFEEIKRHTEIGYEIVDENGFLSNIRDLIRYHHEKMDGSGYHSKKKGSYPWEAMIISIVDIYDALTSDRPYRKALPQEEAIQALNELIGVHFDQRIFDAFLSYIRDN